MKFPKLPDCMFNWRVIQVEPIPLSGERITLGVLVKGGNQEFLSSEVINSENLKKMYGQSFGGGIADGLSLTIRDAKEFYIDKPLSVGWAPPLSDFYVSDVNSSLAENIAQALHVVAMYNSSFYAAVILRGTDNEG